MDINIKLDEEGLNQKIRGYVEEKVGKEISNYLDKNALLPFIREIIKAEVKKEIDNLDKRIISIMPKKKTKKKKKKQIIKMDKADAFQIFT